MPKKDCLSFSNQDNDITIQYYPAGGVYSKKHPVIVVEHNSEATIELGFREIVGYLQRQQDLFADVIAYLKNAHCTDTKPKAIKPKGKYEGF